MKNIYKMEKSCRILAVCRPLRSKRRNGIRTAAWAGVKSAYYIKKLMKFKNLLILDAPAIHCPENLRSGRLSVFYKEAVRIFANHPPAFFLHRCDILEGAEFQNSQKGMGSNMKWNWMKRLFILQLLLALLASAALAALPETLVPVGSTVGIRLQADGLLVEGFDDAGHSAARDAGLQKGDVIKTVNNEAVKDCEQFKAMVATGGGAPMRMAVERDGKTVQLTACPEKAGNGYLLGVYLRDSMAGIGTVTFYDPEKSVYGALGHGVNDLGTMLLLPLEAGEILPSSVVEVRRGASGTPGVLKGAFDTSTVLGTVDCNTDQGIFGRTSRQLSDRRAIPVASANQIHTGKATILSNVDHTHVCEYEVNITKLFPAEQASGRNLLLTITDPRLLRATGGIVQGMSGSPILQDGRLVGAVTHVLVNNPTCGYGIFIENMLKNCAEYQKCG